MTPEELADLRRRAESATPGPWTSSVFNDVGQMVGQVAGPGYIARYSAWLDPDDAIFIAAANPAVVIALLDEIERLQESERAEMERPKWMMEDVP